MNLLHLSLNIYPLSHFVILPSPISLPSVPLSLVPRAIFATFRVYSRAFRLSAPTPYPPPSLTHTGLPGIRVSDRDSPRPLGRPALRLRPGPGGADHRPRCPVTVATRGSAAHIRREVDSGPGRGGRARRDPMIAARRPGNRGRRLLACSLLASGRPQRLPKFTARGASSLASLLGLKNVHCSQAVPLPKRKHVTTCRSRLRYLTKMAW
eukprot:753214-Hanusia_phi.AAC.1